MYDIAIIGAGPAGATLARLIGGKYRVLLVDKRRLDEDADDAECRKCCGGLLAPDAQKMLARLGLGLPKNVLVEPQLFVVRAIDIPRRLERYYQRFYINMDREKFDRWLLSMVPQGVDARFGWRFKGYEAESDHFKITLTDNGGTIAENARILVGADGASARVRQFALPAAPTPRKYLAIQEWVEADASLPYFSALFDPEITDYYCWTIPKNGQLIVGAALHPRDETSDKFDRLKGKLGAFGFRLGKTLRREGTFLLRPTTTRQLSTGTKGIALLGEAGGWISPSSAEGLSYAFRSGLLLAEALQAGLDGFERRYARAMRQLRWNLLLKSWKSRFLFSPVLRNAAMKSGLQSMEVPHA